MAIDLDTQLNTGAKICIFGIGGAGGNAVNNMIARGVKGVTFVTANTDKQALDKTLAENKILLGIDTTKGLGAGANPEVGKAAAEESQEEIKDMLSGYDLIFITCGMGGGTGTGGAPIVANIAQKTGALVVGIVSKCFSREGVNKTAIADEGIAKLKENVDAYIVVPNDKILEVCGAMRPSEAYHKANDILYNATSGIVDIITNDGFINVDFADVKTTLTNAGEVIIGIGQSKGENAAQDAVKQALSSPFLDNLSIAGSKFVLMNIKYGAKYTTDDIDKAYQALREEAGDSIDIKNGEGEIEGEDDFIVTILASAKKVDENEKKKEVKANDVKVNNLKPSTTTKKQNYKNDFCSNFNLFDTQPDTNYSTLLNQETKIKKENIEINSPTHIEIIKEQGYGNRVGRPHGEEELKIYDLPAYLRNGKESKYNDFDSHLTSIENSDSIPQEEERSKLQKIINTTSATLVTNPFIKKLSDSGVSFIK